MSKSGEKKHVALVHGLCHGAWCWYKVVTLLRMKGIEAIAIDMAGCGVDPKQLHNISSIFDYVKPLMDFLASLPDDEKVILVGHSYGGIPIALAMEKFHAKISLAVFVAGYMPNCTQPISALIHQFFRRSSTNLLMDSEIMYDEGVPISCLFKPNFMTTKLFKNCSLEDLELAKTLMRPNLFFVEELGKKWLVSQERYGSVNRCYIICEGDEVVTEELQRYNYRQKLLCIGCMDPCNRVDSFTGPKRTSTRLHTCAEAHPKFAQIDQPLCLLNQSLCIVRPTMCR